MATALHSPLFLLSVVILVSLLLFWLDSAIGLRSLKNLRDQSCSPSHARVSVIVAARNEAQKLEPALRSLVRQDYPNLEVIVVNDRSQDETGQIAERIPGITVIHLSEVPENWLGKNHALHVGAAQATGEWLLFTDADVQMEPSTIRRALSAARDHLAVVPRLILPGFWLQLFGGLFGLLFGLYARPWRVAQTSSPRYVGIGAFNLIRADVYRAVGGHARLAMRPDDDMKLGKIIKRSGYRQDLLLGDGLLSVEWYSTLGELIRGLEKNAFAAVEYRLWAMLIGTILVALLFVWPVIAVVVTEGPTRWCHVAALGVLAGWYADSTRFMGGKTWYCVGLPAAALLCIWILWRATCKTLWTNGIDWRGTHYSLAKLKANRV